MIENNPELIQQLRIIPDSIYVILGGIIIGVMEHTKFISKDLEPMKYEGTKKEYVLKLTDTTLLNEKKDDMYYLPTILSMLCPLNSVQIKNQEVIFLTIKHTTKVYLYTNRYTIS
jgi:hypothetical protein